MFKPLRRLLGYFRARRQARAQAEQAAEAKRRQGRVSYLRRRARERAVTLLRAQEATRGTFVVADLETTGLSGEDEIVEIAALRVDHVGRVLAEFSTLVRIRGYLPERITRLTGITRQMVASRGVPLGEALSRFLGFCRKDPVFFYNAPFDKRFLQAACERLALSFENEVHCSLKVARAAWPQLRSHKLVDLARHLNAPLPAHRGLDDVRTTLYVLMYALRGALRRAA